MSNLGLFVLSLATSDQKTIDVPEKQAVEIRDNLANQISSKIEEIRNAQRREEEESLSVTIF